MKTSRLPIKKVRKVRLQGLVPPIMALSMVFTVVSIVLNLRMYEYFVFFYLKINLPASLASTLNSFSGPNFGDVKPLPCALTLDAFDFAGDPSTIVTGNGDPSI